MTIAGALPYDPATAAESTIATRTTSRGRSLWVALAISLAAACGVEGQPAVQRLPRSFDTFALDTTPHGALHALWGSADDDIWAVGEAGLVLHFDGRRWARVETPTLRTLRAVHGCAPDDVWIVGSDVVLHYDGGAWQRVSTPGLYPGALRSVFCAATGEVWAAEHYTVIRLLDGRWRRAGELTDEGPQRPTVVWGPAGGGIWAAGGDGVFRFTGGRRWARELLHEPPIHAIAGTAFERWAAGAGGLLRYRPRGETTRAGWFPVAIPGVRAAAFDALCVDGQGQVVAAGELGLAQRREGRWSLDQRLGRDGERQQRIHALWHAPSGAIFGVGAERDPSDEGTRALLLKLREQVIDARVSL